MSQHKTMGSIYQEYKTFHWCLEVVHLPTQVKHIGVILGVQFYGNTWFHEGYAAILLMFKEYGTGKLMLLNPMEYAITRTGLNYFVEDMPIPDYFPGQRLYKLVGGVRYNIKFKEGTSTVGGNLFQQNLYLWDIEWDGLQNFAILKFREPGSSTIDVATSQVELIRAF